MGRPAGDRGWKSVRSEDNSSALGYGEEHHPQDVCIVHSSLIPGKLTQKKQVVIDASLITASSTDGT